MLDAADLSALTDFPPDIEVFAGYIGGEAQHVWAISDWQRVDNYKKLPIYVNRTGTTGLHDGWECLMMLYNLKVPLGTAVGLDTELRQSNDDHYYDDIYAVLHYFGYIVWKYGSQSWLFNLQAMDGYWEASPQVSGNPNIPSIPSASNLRAYQYFWGNLANPNVPYDLSAIHRMAYSHRLSADWLR